MTTFAKSAGKSFLAVLFVAFFIFFAAPNAVAEDEVGTENLLDMSIEELLNLDLDAEESQGITIYGYMSANVEKVFNELSVENGQTVKTSAPHEWSLPHFHLFLRAPLSKDIYTFVNLASENLEVRNMYGNIRLKNMLQFRAGKMYRRFGLFNEKLDEVPTYLGIEPPELFDGDHLLLPRMTNFMVHGETEIGGNTWSYALCTDNGEGGPTEDVIPLGWDFRVKLQNRAMIGMSGYFSSIGSGDITSPIDVGEGSPEGGILPWVETDRYQVYGGFAEVQLGSWLFKTAYWIANHNIERNPEAVLAVIENADITERQYERFVGDRTLAAEALSVDDVIRTANYKVTTGYVRVGYHIKMNRGGTIAPFFFFDWMNHPETIGSKTWGGDNESGIADDGKFYKWTAGVAYKPIDKVAIKLDTSTHIQKYNGATETYPEVRFDISYLYN